MSKVIFWAAVVIDLLFYAAGFTLWFVEEVQAFVGLENYMPLVVILLAVAFLIMSSLPKITYG